MKRTVLVTGAGSGIGQASAELLRSRGHNVITSDLSAADVNADLSDPLARHQLVEEVASLCGGCLDGVVAAAGLSAFAPPRKVLAVNYFAVTEVLDMLRPMLAKSSSPRAVAIASTAVFTPLPADPALVEAMLAGNEESTLRLADDAAEYVSYPSSKKAVALWVRRAATAPEWAGQNILLNALGPGRTNTPMIAELLATEQGRQSLDDATPMVLPKPYAEPSDIAYLVASLLEMEPSIMVGQIIYADGGTDAVRRPDHV